MIDKKHQGEKPYLDNLYYEDIFEEEYENGTTITIGDEVYYVVAKGFWRKLNPFDVSVDKNNIQHILSKKFFNENTNFYDDRNLSWKEINFRI